MLTSNLARRALSIRGTPVIDSWNTQPWRLADSTKDDFLIAIRFYHYNILLSIDIPLQSDKKYDMVGSRM